MFDRDAKKRILARSKTCIVKESGISVYHGYAPDESISGLIDRDREDRQRQIVGAFLFKRPRGRY
jgi:hypothetical protein